MILKSIGLQMNPYVRYNINDVGKMPILSGNDKIFSTATCRYAYYQDCWMSVKHIGVGENWPKDIYRVISV